MVQSPEIFSEDITDLESNGDDTFWHVHDQIYSSFKSMQNTQAMINRRGWLIVSAQKKFQRSQLTLIMNCLELSIELSIESKIFEALIRFIFLIIYDVKLSLFISIIFVSNIFTYYIFSCYLILSRAVPVIYPLHRHVAEMMG
jgi:hypothetical protein